MLAAQVIGASADPTSHTLFINRGERDRLRRNMGVITPDGVVGKIVEVFPSTAQVLLINDKDSGVGALFAVSRTHGVVRGSGDPEPHMEYVINEEKLQPGDVIVTSGEDRIFPKDLLIGTVGATKPGNPFQAISVQPAARLDRLEDVIVLLSLQELAPKKSEESSEAAGAARDGAQPPQSSAPAPKSSGIVTDPNKFKPPAAHVQPAAPRYTRLQRRSRRSLNDKMAYLMNIGGHSEPNIEVHKFYGGTVLGTCLLALVFQTFLHKYGRWSELIDLPLLVTIYFGVSRRNPVSGLFLGGRHRHTAGCPQPRQSDRHVRHRQNHRRLSGFVGWCKN